jgi:NADPH:quinone reductase-like Zn-dependent oxidoreductase
MCAVRFDRYGGRDALHLADVPVPSPAPGEVLVEVARAPQGPAAEEAPAAAA